MMSFLVDSGGNTLEVQPLGHHFLETGWKLRVSPHLLVPSRSLTAKAPENRPKAPKGKVTCLPFPPFFRDKRDVKLRGCYPKWVFPKITVPQNGWFIMENLTKMDDLGVLLFLETPIF